MASRRFIALLFAVVLLSAGRGGAAERFFKGIDDLPVMPGLEQVIGAGVVFDTPAGRIVEVAAEGAVTRAQVEQFYAGVLPQLGWRRAEGGWRREGERLRIGFGTADGVLTVRISLSP
jgi:hypothetical protein